MGLFDIFKKKKEPAHEEPKPKPKKEPKKENNNGVEYFPTKEFKRLRNLGVVVINIQSSNYFVATENGVGISISQLNVVNNVVKYSVNGFSGSYIADGTIKGLLLYKGKLYYVVDKAPGYVEEEPTPSSDGDSEFERDEQFDLGSVSQIIIDTDIADVEVYLSNVADQQIGEVITAGNISGHSSFKFDTYVKDNILYVKEKCTGNNIRSDYKICVYILNYTIDRVQIHTASGNIYYGVGGSAFINGDFKSESGTIDVDFSTTGLDPNYCNFDTFNIKTESGNIHYNVEYTSPDNTWAYQHLNVSTENGNVDLEKLCAINLDVKSENGNINAAGYINNVKAESEAGNINIEQTFFADGDVNIKTDYGNINYTPRNLNEMNLKTKGDVDNNFEPGNGGFTANAKLSTNQGDITIE